MIESIDGTGSTDGTFGHAAHHLGRHVILRGSNLLGATVTLNAGAGPVALDTCVSSHTTLTVALPVSIAADATYTLTAMNQAGEACAEMSLLAGEPGATGPTGAKGDKGDAGAQGLKGDTGAQGLKGDPGTPGAKGDTGAQGIKGDTGAPGAPGVPCAGCVNAASIAAGAVGTSHLSAAVYGGSGSATSVARSDHAHTSPAFSCTLEFGYLETGTSPQSYWPSAAKRAEILTNGWICWNRSDDGVQISPTTDNVNLNRYYFNWDAANPKACGRITFISGTSAAMLANLSFMAHSDGEYFGLRQLDGDNVFHGRWFSTSQGMAAEASGGVGTGDHWSIWTCR